MALKWFTNYDEKTNVDSIAINPEHVVSIVKDDPLPDGTPLTQVYMVTGLVFTVVGTDLEIATILNEKD